jgi:general secretion pathway protein C
VNQERNTVQHALHYRYRLATSTKAPVKKSRRSGTTTQKASLASYRLIAIYSRSDYAVVTLVKGSKSFVLTSGANGGNVKGFHLKDANATTARFQKGNTITTLKLYEKKMPTAAVSTAIRPIKARPEKRKIKNSTAPKPKSAPIANREDGTKMIDRTLIREYTQNPDKIWKNIGLYEVKHEGKLEGFKVRFVRKGSPFEKLGLRRGDVIKSINGEPIVDYATPMRMLKSADAIDDLSITVERNHEEQELKYEVK